MATLSNIRAFDYDQVMLIPKECKVSSRSSVDVKATLNNGSTFNLPVVPANMSSIMDQELAFSLAEKGFFYVMHRFDVDPIDFVGAAREREVFSSISVGVKSADYDKMLKLYDRGLRPNYVTVDIAHGHSSSVVNMVQSLKSMFPKAYVIAGNVASVDGALALEKAGADALKCGIAPGLACTTGPNTGFGSRGWQLSMIEQVADALKKADLIADGGIRHDGDIAKSVAFGADMVMVGSMLAGHDENPGEVVTDKNGEVYKVYYGSASQQQKGEAKNVEGRSVMVPYKGSIWGTLRRMTENLQSSVSYAGGYRLSDLQNVEYVIL